MRAEPYTGDFLNSLMSAVEVAEQKAEKLGKKQYHPYECGPCDEQCAARLERIRNAQLER